MQIDITNPQQQTLFFSVIFLTAIFLSVRKNYDDVFFSHNLTNELKGFAILTIIFSHIGYFLSTNTQFLYPYSILAGVGVNLFLFLSGFGLTASSLDNKLTVIDFYKRRLLKIFLPLWLVIPLILILDSLLLQRTYPAQIILQNLLGFFPRADLYLDLNSPLWYFSFIIFYYLIFPILFIKKLPLISSLLILASTLILIKLNLPINKDVLKLYQLHTLAFPLGMIFALVVKKRLLEHLKIPSFLKIPTLLISIIAFSYFAIHSGVGEGLGTEQFLSLVTTFLVVLIFLIKQIRIRLFSLFGIMSYEIYLIHWPILSRFDFLYKNLPPYLATIIYLCLFLVLGLSIQKIISTLLKLIPQQET